MSDKTEKTTAEIEENINTDLEAAQDEAFGTDVEISAQAAEEAGEQTSEESAAQIKADEEQREEAAAEEEGEGTAEKKAEEGAKTEEKAPEEDKAAQEKKASDEETEDEPYKVPDDIKGRTRERFEKLTGNLKEAHGTVEKQEGVIKGFREVIARTGMNPDELQRTLTLGGLMKSNPQQALVELNKVVADLAAQIGEVAPGADALAGQEDLKQKVVDRELTIEDATTIAQARLKAEASKRATDLAAQNAAQQQQQEASDAQVQEQFNGRVETASNGVREFLLTIQNDPDADKMAPYLISAAQFASENLEPEKWMGYIKSEHAKVKQIASATGTQGARSTPIMDGGIPPGGGKEPQSLEQLADQML